MRAESVSGTVFSSILCVRHPTISRQSCVQVSYHRTVKRQFCGVGVGSRWSRMFSAGVGVVFFLIAGVRVGFSKLLESESGVGTRNPKKSSDSTTLVIGLRENGQDHNAPTVIFRPSWEKAPTPWPEASYESGCGALGPSSPSSPSRTTAPAIEVF